MNEKPAPSAPDGLPQRFGRNVTMNFVALGTTGLSSLIMTPLLLHGLGRSAYGVWVLAGSVIAYLELLELGFGRATTRLLAEDAGERPEMAVRTLNTNIAVLLGFAVVALLAGVAIAFAAPTLFSVPSDLRTAAVVAFLALAVAISVSIPGDSLGGALAAHQRYDLLAASNMGLVIATALGLGGVLITGGGLVALAIVSAAVSLPFHVVRYLLLRSLLPELRLSRRLVDRSRIRATVAVSWWFLLVDLAVTVVLRVDLVVVGLMFNVRAVAVYAVGAKAAQLSLTALTGLVQVYFPHATALARQGRRDDLRALVIDGTRTALMLSLPLTAVLVVLAHPLIRLWVGPGYGQAAQTFVVLALAMAVRSVAWTSSLVLSGQGMVRSVAAASVVEAVVNLGASVGLALAMGPVGVAVGTLVGSVAVQLPWMVLLSCRRADLNLRRFGAEALRPHLLPAIAGAVVLGVALLLVSGNTPALAACTVFAVVVYAVVYAARSATGSERARVAGAVAALRRGVRPGPPRR